MGRTTIKDVANQVGVSTTTVSVVMNQKKHHISKETQEAIFKAAKKLNYRPNQLAVSMVTKKSNTIALVVPDILNPFFAELVNCIGNEAARHNYTTIFYCTNDQPLDVEYVKSAIDRNVEAIVLALSDNFQKSSIDECYRLADEARVPILLVDRYVDTCDVVCVRVDHELGGYLATKHLLDLGHRRIACVTGPMNSDVSKQRLFGYIRALQEYNVLFDPMLVGEGKFHVETGYDLFEGLYERGISAIFASSDTIAYGIYKKAYEMGLAIPKDISVVGYDNNTYNDFLPAPLTSVSQNVQEIGHNVVKVVLNFEEVYGKESHRILLKPELMIRRSTLPFEEK